MQIRCHSLGQYITYQYTTCKMLDGYQINTSTTSHQVWLIMSFRSPAPGQSGDMAALSALPVAAEWTLVIFCPSVRFAGSFAAQLGNLSRQHSEMLSLCSKAGSLCAHHAQTPCPFLKVCNRIFHPTHMDTSSPATVLVEAHRHEYCFGSSYCSEDCTAVHRV